MLFLVQISISKSVFCSHMIIGLRNEVFLFVYNREWYALKRLIRTYRNKTSFEINTPKKISSPKTFAHFLDCLTITERLSFVKLVRYDSCNESVQTNKSFWLDSWSFTHMFRKVVGLRIFLKTEKLLFTQKASCFHKMTCEKCITFMTMIFIILWHIFILYFIVKSSHKNFQGTPSHTVFDLWKSENNETSKLNWSMKLCIVTMPKMASSYIYRELCVIEVERWGYPVLPTIHLKIRFAPMFINSTRRRTQLHW